MDKIKINNQVVIMRKFVKQAKVHSINRLVKQMKILQNRKGDEAKVEKCKRKAERFREEIVLLKSIKPDDVSKSALSKARDWKEILQQKTSTLDERCLAMLASYEAVQKEVESFYSSNPNLVTRIPNLVKEWEERSKLLKCSPFDKQKKKLEKYNPCKEHIISSNALDKEVLPINVKKIKVGVHDDLNKLGYDSDVMQHDMYIEDKKHKSESLKGNKNQPKINSSKLLKKIPSSKLYENIKSNMSVDEELESGNNVTHEYKECKAKNVERGKNPTKQKIRRELISNKLQSKIFPVKFSKNVQSDKSSDEDFRSDNDVAQSISDEGNENKFKRVRKSKDQTQQKIKIYPVKFPENVESDKSTDEDLNDKDVTQEDNKLQNENYHAKLSKIFKSHMSSDEELCINGEDSTNNTDLEEADSERNISESDSSESIDQDNTVKIRGKFNENNQEQLKSDDDDGSDFFLRIERKRKLPENKNLSSAKERAGKKNEKILLEKPTTPKQMQSNLSLDSYRNMTENNLKTITMLNLDDLQGLNEIPVEEKTEQEENFSKDKEKFPTQKRKDPFFLGSDELDPISEDRVTVSSSNEKRQKFKRNEKSNFEKKSFQKSLNTSQFSGREPYNERNFKKGGFQPRDSTNRFQHKGKNEIQSKDQRCLNRKERRAFQSKNLGDLYIKGKNDFQPGYQEDFNRKGKNDLHTFGKKTHDKQSRKSNFQKEGNSSFRKDRMSNIKGCVINEKPLHPSWEAKRKQKELTQTQFQGKKMVFND